ncbi:Protein fam86a [Rhizoclosmatium sp. JEL0117]|nr:Protein fam86a [Rhizoclosmatium sp. JEL0117]
MRHFDFSGLLMDRLTSSAQISVLSATVQHPLAVAFPPPQRYITLFLKQLIARIEGQRILAGEEEDEELGVCIDDLLETFMAYMTTGNNETDSMSYRSYSMTIDSEDVDPLYVTLAEHSQTISNGTTGLRTWPAALKLVSHLISAKQLMKPKKVLELGCGVGLAGIACGVLGLASSIEFTDVDPTVLATVSKNCAINFGESGESKFVETKVSALDWEAISDSALKDRVTESSADLIIASDVAYDPVIVAPFVRVLNAFLRRETKETDRVEALVATTRRAESTWELFVGLLKQNGLEFDLLEVPDLGLFYFDEPGRIDLMRIYAV